MINIAQTVENILRHDDIALTAAREGWLNLSSYARSIQPIVSQSLMKDVQEGSIITALSRLVTELTSSSMQASAPSNAVQSLAVHGNLQGMTYERSEDISGKIREIYHRVATSSKTFLTVTQGINEITIIAESAVAEVFRRELRDVHTVYDKQNLVGITVKFAPNNLEVPNLIFALTRRLAYRDINIIEIVSTATELTYIIEKPDLTRALEQLQKDF